MKKFTSFLYFLLLSLLTVPEGFSSFDNKENDKCPFSLCAVVTQDEFLERFERMGRIGGGGEARVYSVKNRDTQEPYALVLYNDLKLLAQPDYRKDLIQRLIENQDINPHQGKIHGYFWILNPNYPYIGGAKEGVLPFQNVREGRLLDDTYANDPDATPYRHEAILMEQGLGDLESQSFRNLNFDPVLERLICRLSSYNLYEAFIIPSDNKARNYIFVKTSGQTYLGEKMDSYDFLRYEIESQVLYIPTPSHIIKRIDYGCWRLGELNFYTGKIPILERLSDCCSVTKEEFINRFCQPPQDPNARILSIRTWNKV